MADNDFPSIDIEKLIELWQQEECLWNISLEGYQQEGLEGEAVDRIREAFDNKYTCAYMHNFCGKEQQVM